MPADSLQAADGWYIRPAPIDSALLPESVGAHIVGREHLQSPVARRLERHGGP